jgi:hypothetical protein
MPFSLLQNVVGEVEGNKLPCLFTKAAILGAFCRDVHGKRMEFGQEQVRPQYFAFYWLAKSMKFLNNRTELSERHPSYFGGNDDEATFRPKTG